MATTYLSPGVYIEEISAQQPIEGVSTSVTGMVGLAQMGPLDMNPPVLVTSFPDYQRTFGGYFSPALSGSGTPGDTYNLLPHAVAGFFNNGGQLLYIKRVGSSATPPSAASATTNLENSQTPPTTIMTRLTRTAFPGDTTLYLANLRGIKNGVTLTLNQVQYATTAPIVTITPTSSALTVASYNSAQNSVTLSGPIPSGSVANYNWQNTTVAVTGGAPYTPAPPPASGAFMLNAQTPGIWGNSIALQITPSSRTQTSVAGVGNASPGTNNLIQLLSGANFYAGAIVEFDTGTDRFYAKVQSVAGSAIQLVTGVSVAQAGEITTNLSATPPVPVTIRTCEFDVVASYGNVNESFRGLTLDNTTPYYYATTIINGSALLGVPFVSGTTLPSDETTADPSTMPVAADGMNVPLTGGSDGAYPTPFDYQGVDLGAGSRTGIQSLIDASEISIIAAPGITDQITQNALITQCETLLYRFAILDPAPSATGGTPSLTDIQNQRNLYDTHYAAIYYPRVVVSDPLTGNPLAISPSGHMAGIYAQTDSTRGVWKAPANVVINGILSLETKLSKGDQDILNPEPMNICALRDFTAQGLGLRVYGARCITTDTEWMYINVRRLFIFLEASLDQGLQWAVFEPNSQRLWNQLIQSVSAFLNGIWQQGGLMGATADQAYFVKCGNDTMSTADQENGRLIMVIGVAPVFPAEFVIIQIGQWQGGSSVQEL